MTALSCHLFCIMRDIFLSPLELAERQDGKAKDHASWKKFLKTMFQGNYIHLRRRPTHLFDAVCAKESYTDGSIYDTYLVCAPQTGFGGKRGCSVTRASVSLLCATTTLVSMFPTIKYRPKWFIIFAEYECILFWKNQAEIKQCVSSDEINVPFCCDINLELLYMYSVQGKRVRAYCN